MDNLRRPPTRTSSKAPWHKKIRNFFVLQFRYVRHRLISISPLWLRRFFAPIYDFLDILLIDYGIFRLLYLNKHQFSEKAWRSAQPWPYQISNIVRAHNIRTVVNLRGRRDSGSYRMEKGICDKLGINLSDDLILFSRTAPSREMILKFKAHFEALEHPILIHCKSGADRMGLASVLYLHLIDQVPIEKALDQLSLRYGHIKQAKTGILDEFFKSYLTYKKDNNITFIEWVESVYDERELKNTYNSQSWADALVDLILRRE